ncbi:MAG: glycosyltransferase family 4 protein [Terriglobales bacterium]
MRLWLRAKALRQFENCPYRVCVDLNFLNWYKTFRGDAQTGCVWVIPNAAPAVAWLKDRETRYSPVRIIFARRFIPERGTRVIAEAIRSVLTRHPDVHVTFAGSGPEEAYLRSCFSAYPQVQICAYASPAAVQTHQCHDIAVVPSLASEGTTLSVVEAMSAGCAVVASAVGGITNQIVTGYNGVLVRPEAGCFASALDSLIRDHRLRLQIQRRAWETATAAFTIGRWREQWMEVLDWVEHNRSGVR